jgi:hypothetical protein
MGSGPDRDRILDCPVLTSSSSSYSDPFTPHQIVFIEHQGTRLYTEVIQVIGDRQLCWVRPLVLVPAGAPPILYPSFPAAPYGRHGYKLGGVPDMIWPMAQLAPALDVDVLPLLDLAAQKPTEEEPGSNLDDTSQQFFHQFIASLWSPREGAPLCPDEPR